MQVLGENFFQPPMSKKANLLIRGRFNLEQGAMS
jgi:hypothetical protein